MIDLEAIETRYPLPPLMDLTTKLRRTGHEWVGLCPFHSENTRSFFIFNCGTRFHCLGCREGGVVLDFVSRNETASFTEKDTQMDKITVSIADAAKALSLGRSKIYELIASGELVIIKIGRRSLVTVDSIRSLVKFRGGYAS
jgi:excisionase family DNA binding protein